MARYAQTILPFFLAAASLLQKAPAQVFVVGEKSATQDVATAFQPTDVALPSERISERGRRELERMLVAEQGFAHRALPMGTGVTLTANGPLAPDAAQYRHMLFQKGQSAGPGDRVVITAMAVKQDRLVLDLNGGPFQKHRFLSHIQLNDSNVVAPQEQVTGARVTLVFPKGLPDLTAPEVKALLEPVIDFGVKTSDEAYADTLPAPLRDAIAAHEILVGMSHRMVLAALGQPESKMREHTATEGGTISYEEWIYGRVPQTVKFVRFQGDRVSMLEIAELGKPIQIHDKDEMAGYNPPPPTREIHLGDAVAAAQSDGAASAPPTLRRPEEPAPASSSGRVQMPADKPTSPPAAPDPAKPFAPETQP